MLILCGMLSDTVIEPLNMQWEQILWDNMTV